MWAFEIDSNITTILYFKDVYLYLRDHQMHYNCHQAWLIVIEYVTLTPSLSYFHQGGNIVTQYVT